MNRVLNIWLGLPTRLWNKCKFLTRLLRVRANGATVRSWELDSQSLGNSDAIGYKCYCKRNCASGCWKFLKHLKIKLFDRFVVGLAAAAAFITTITIITLLFSSTMMQLSVLCFVLSVCLLFFNITGKMHTFVALPRFIKSRLTLCHALLDTNRRRDAGVRLFNN